MMWARIAAVSASLAAFALPLTTTAQNAYPAQNAGQGTIAREISGDLTGDGIAERVLLITKDDPANVIDNDKLGNSQIDLNPRSLLVLQQTADGWQEIARADDFIPTAGNMVSPCLADPLLDGAIVADDGKLTILYHYWLSCGSYGVTNRRYTFRFEAGRFRLIGFDRLEFSRSTGMGDEVSINYLTSRRKITSGIIVIGEPAAPPPIERWDEIGSETHFLDEMSIAACDDWDSRPSWC